MPTFESNGCTIRYEVEGEGPDIVLVHGFASSLEGNWRQTGVIKTLLEGGRRVIALDCRGHGESDKPHNPAAYGGTKMADDVLALMDHLGVERADIMGYSMGGAITASILARHPERLRSAILGGVGDALVVGGRPPSRGQDIAVALEADELPADASPTARAFRQFADSSDNDRLALAAIQRSDRGGYDPATLREVDLPVLVLVGEKDPIIGTVDKIVETIPGSKLVKVPGDHLTALNREYRAAVVEFLAEASPVGVAR